ncbi:RNA polymerase sigma factor, sigma-70 family [Catalinimonas alkaloidigena]|uniref:RNA polymerase sigma factor, sigma-70 family n=1 Tax=Catalinimonas alkaloidigena TaxID=1075417 RepID=A0A1G9GE64_9BACT|nr:sigma-70 family RNA polymerase sigma factor [Catalinimonas alkaloidigena]SDK98865.1 RNA polymerase sigma factor, sigma-70 family [Catalinimonas alkaloidigena]
MPTNATDIALWEQFRQGDAAAYEQLYRRFAPTLYSYAVRFAPHEPEWVEDCIQELFIYLWQHRTQVGPTASVKHYLFKALRREVMRRFRRPRRLITYGSEEATYEFLLSLAGEADRQDQEQRQEQSAHLRRIIERLPSQQKEALLLRFHDELTPDEIADILSVSARTVYRLLDRALATLKKNRMLQTLLLAALWMS